MYHINMYVYITNAPASSSHILTDFFDYFVSYENVTKGEGGEKALDRIRFVLNEKYANYAN